jgi:oxazoline/thiazoline synthase
MLSKPAFKQHFHAEIIEPDTVYLLSERGHSILRGQAYSLIAPFLNGQHTVVEIASILQFEISEEKINNAISRLEKQGYVTEGEDVSLLQEAAFWSLQGIDFKAASSKLVSKKVAVKSFGSVDDSIFIHALESLKVNIGEEGDLTVVLTDDYLQVGLDKFNHNAELTKKPWLLIKPVGAVIWLGPLFIPGVTGCWECLAQRLRANRQVETFIGNQKGITTPFPVSRAMLPSSLHIAVNLAAAEVAKWLALDEHQQLEGGLMTFDTVTLATEKHILVKQPHCNACSCSLTMQKPRPIVLNSQIKQDTNDSENRYYSAEETLQKHKHHISPITGIVGALTKMKFHNNLIHVYTATHQFGSKPDSLNSLRQGLGVRSAGKGKTDLQSKVSAFCEAIEHYSGLFSKNDYHLISSFSRIKTEAIHPSGLLNYSNKQYENRIFLNSSHGDYAWVAEPFKEEEEIEWTPVWSLTNHTFKYLPTAFCYYGSPINKEHQFCRGDSNGSAAGNTLEEAILQGFMELVERDCVAIWWYNRLQRPAVDLHSFNDPYLEKLLIFIKEQDCELWVLDITNNFNIPSFVAIIRQINKPSEKIMLGFGTHFDPKIGIIRAVTELNQMLAINLLHNDKQKYPDPDTEYWMKNATVKNQPYLLPIKDSSLKVSTDYDKYWSGDLKQDVLKCVEIAASQGLEILVLDQTRPDIQLNVVKVVVPGLRHFWPRFAPGRLYDVPVEMGWLSEPMKEEELNPIPIFI